MEGIEEAQVPEAMAAGMNAGGQAVSGSKGDEYQQPVAKPRKSGQGQVGDVARGRPAD
jgi:hypothetical protein